MSKHAHSTAASTPSETWPYPPPLVELEPAPAPDLLDPERIPPDEEQLLVLLGERLQGIRPQVALPLADPGDALVGVHQREVPRLPRVPDHEGLDVDDSHYYLEIRLRSVACIASERTMIAP
jgi:hypothetical protein